MLTYKDMTFCDAICKNTQCYRMLTREIMDKAKAANMPVALGDFHLDCEGYREKELDEYYGD